MINVLMSGCNGKMGQVISHLALQKEDLKIVAGYDLRDTIKNDYPVFTDFKKIDLNEIKIDIVIDFSNPEALPNLLDFCTNNKIALVLATTGLSVSQKKEVENAAKQIPIFYSANMSLGVNLLINLVKKAAIVLAEDFDIEIIEKHHNQKIDAPSGTALAIADGINDALGQSFEYTYDRHSRRKKRAKKEIGIHAVRGGTIVGDHSVIFAGNDELIELNHIALSKDIFAVGALNAAKFLSTQKEGLYNMESLIASKK